MVDKSGALLGIYPNNSPAPTVPASKSIVTAIAPTRVSFAGGGSDLNYWFDDQPGCVVNLAINRFARVTIAKNYSSTCTIRSMNTGEILQLSSSDIPTYRGSKLALVAACLRKCKIKDGLDIDIYSDFEPGTGLGGSSSLVIALVVGLSELSNYKFTRRQLINFCYDIERNLVGISGGWQDQIAAAHGGLCVTYFNEGQFSTHKIELSRRYTDLLSSSLFLVQIGGARESSQIHMQQQKVSSSVAYRRKMKNIVQLAMKCADNIGQEKLENFGEVLHEGWLLKKSLGEFISSPGIDIMYEKMMSFGAAGGRLLGAGKTGFLLIYVLPSKQPSFINKCLKENIKVERINIDSAGARVI